MSGVTGRGIAFLSFTHLVFILFNYLIYWEDRLSKIAIITDSTVNLPENILRQYPITVLPQVLIWSGETYEDGVDVHPGEFYERLKSAKEMPSTSQVTPKSFLGAYQKLLDEGYEILSILISQGLSGTISSAVQALEAFPGAPIEIVEFANHLISDGFSGFARS